MAVRYRDYDAAFAELNGEAPPIVIHLFGEDWQLPGDPPAAVVVRLARMIEDGRSEEELRDGELMNLAFDAVPREVLEAWLAKGLGTSQLALILEDVINAYGAQLAPQDQAPEAPAPETGASTSSTSPWPTGESSRPTSPASTPASSGPFQLR